MLLALCGCASPDEPTFIPEPDIEAFAADVYPTLLRDCGFPECHGDSGRFFQVFGPGRSRLQRDVDPYAPTSEGELRQSYDRARSMLAGPDGMSRSLLLRKPLARRFGGAQHAGDNLWGEPIYGSPEHPSFRKLVEWALRSSAPRAGSAP